MTKVIDFELTKQNDSIENLFAKKFEDCYKVPMDNETSLIFMKLLLLKGESLEIQESEKPFIYKLIDKRISILHNYQVDDRILIFLSVICQSAGEGIMYVWYLQYESKKRSLTFITFEDFANIFADGFPTSETLQHLWENQKVTSNDTLSSDNLLDYPNAGLSLF